MAAIGYTLSSEEQRPEALVEQAARAEEVGFYDHVYVHQIGPEQEGFFDFYERSVLPELR